VEPEWDVVERGLGLELPAEYKELLAVFPPGSFLLPDWKDIIVQPRTTWTACPITLSRSVRR
jgi:hypothetical protein